MLLHMLSLNSEVKILNVCGLYVPTMKLCEQVKKKMYIIEDIREKNSWTYLISKWTKQEIMAASLW